MKTYFTSLQAGRGVGAIAVVLAHVTIFSADHLRRPFLGGAWNAATVVVDFFFVLSGFIILYIHRHALGVPSESMPYLYRRIVRIYPLVIVVTALKVAYMFAHGSGFFPEHKRDVWYIISSTLLLPRDDPPFLEVSWPLGYEVLCYLLFVLAICHGRRIVPWACAHACGCLLLNLPHHLQMPLPIRFVFSPYVLEFYLGCVAAHLVSTRSMQPAAGGACVCAGMLLLGAGIWRCDAVVRWLFNLHHLYWGAALFLIVLGAVVLERQTTLRPPRWLCFLGDASYSIYLMHTNVIVFGGFMIQRRLAGFESHLTLTLSLLAGAGLIAGVLCYVYLEKPLLRWLQTKAPRRADLPDAKKI